VLQVVRSRFRISLSSVDLFSLSNPFRRNMALWFAQPLTEMSTRNIPLGEKGRDKSVVGV
jgi:hypothetical protein